MPSNPKRLHQAMQHIRRIQAGDYPQIQQSPDDKDGYYRIVERPWRDVPERSKLAILQDAVDWSGITNRDQSHILLAAIDPGKITDAQRNRLIDMAGVKDACQHRLEERARAGIGREKEMEPEP